MLACRSVFRAARRESRNGLKTGDSVPNSAFLGSESLELRALSTLAAVHFEGHRFALLCAPYPYSIALMPRLALAFAGWFRPCATTHRVSRCLSAPGSAWIRFRFSIETSARAGSRRSACTQSMRLPNVRSRRPAPPQTFTIQSQAGRPANAGSYPSMRAPATAGLATGPPRWRPSFAIQPRQSAVFEWTFVVRFRSKRGG